MDEAKKEDSIPTLTLDPGAATAAAVETAPAPTAQAVGDAARVDAPVEKLDMASLTMPGLSDPWRAARTYSAAARWGMGFLGDQARDLMSLHRQDL